MRELRSCPVTGAQVLLNDGWVDRPSREPVAADCWYCGQPGPLIVSEGDVRVTPHPVPALGVEGDARVHHEDRLTHRDALGAHELIYGAHEGEDAPLLHMVARRIDELRKDQRLRGFRAVRRHRAGGHVAWQLLALPFDTAPSACASWRDGELGRGDRVVRRGDAAVICAYAPRVPFETWIVPTHGLGGMPSLIPAMADALRWTLGRLDDALDAPPIDVVVEDGAPWRLVLLPRLAAPNAVEVATGLPMHGVFPEAAARFLRG